jgi:hypothetical protein
MHKKTRLRDQVQVLRVKLQEGLEQHQVQTMRGERWGVGYQEDWEEMVRCR